MREPNDTSMLHVKKCANVPTREGYKVHGINNNEARHPCPAHGESSVWFECTSCADKQKAYRTTTVRQAFASLCRFLAQSSAS